MATAGLEVYFTMPPESAEQTPWTEIAQVGGLALMTAGVCFITIGVVDRMNGQVNNTHSKQFLE